MTPLEASVADAARALRAEGARFALLGGLAVSARTEPRFTRDADFAVAVATDPAAEALAHALTAHGYRIFAVVQQDDRGRLAPVRLKRDREPPGVVDLLFASSGIEPETVEEADELEVFPGQRLPVAAAPHLVVLKLLARDDATRPQDAADLVQLRRVVTPAEIARMHELARLVMDRGFGRGRDLVALAEAFAASRGRE